MADTLIGPGDEILLPALKEAQKTTAEAELGIIMGRDCRDVPEEDWESAIVGYTTVLDMTEESILKGNDFVQRQPPLSDHREELPDVLLLRPPARHARRGARRSEAGGPERAQRRGVREEHGRSHDPPSRPASFPCTSSIQGWYAGDVLSTGTPRAFHIQDGDVAECRIVGPDGFEMAPLKNPVVDLKLHRE